MTEFVMNTALSSVIILGRSSEFEFVTFLVESFFGVASVKYQLFLQPRQVENGNTYLV